MGTINSIRPRWKTTWGLHLNFKEKNTGTKRAVSELWIKNKRPEETTTYQHFWLTNCRDGTSAEINS